MVTRGESYDLFCEWSKLFLDKLGVSVAFRVGYHDIARMAFKASYDLSGDMLDLTLDYIKTKGLNWGLDAEKIALILDEVVKKPWLDNIVTKQSLP